MWYARVIRQELQRYRATFPEERVCKERSISETDGTPSRSLCFEFLSGDLSIWRCENASYSRFSLWPYRWQKLLVCFKVRTLRISFENSIGHSEVDSEDGIGLLSTNTLFFRDMFLRYSLLLSFLLLLFHRSQLRLLFARFFVRKVTGKTKPNFVAARVSLFFSVLPRRFFP